MAQRRMFSKKITDTDSFIDMSASAQNLYFHLNMNADDDGFVGSPKKVQRTVGASQDDLSLLMAKQFIIPFESGIVVIKDWKIHNYIRADRYSETMYKEERRALEIDENGSYRVTKEVDEVLEIVDVPQFQPEDIPVVIPNNNQTSYQRLPQDRLGKDRLGKDSIKHSVGQEPPNKAEPVPYKSILDYLNEKTGRGFKNVEANKKLIRARWNEGYSQSDFEKVIDNMVTNWKDEIFSNGVAAKTYLQPSTLFSGSFDKYLNQIPIKQTASASNVRDESEYDFF